MRDMRVKRIIVNILRNLIRVGKVSSINYEKGMVKVTFPDKNNIVTNELPYLSYEYNMPKIGDTVLCIFLGNGITKGFCLGKFYNDINLPVQPGERYYYKNIYDECYTQYDKEEKEYIQHAINMKTEAESIYVDFIRELDDSFVQYDPDAKTLTLSIENIVLDGQVNINGDLSVDGDISANGNISATGTVHGSNI